jgi:hypothetical protein
MYPGACLTCGGDVFYRNGTKDGICMKCGPVAFDVVQRKDEHVEGFSTSAWRQREEHVAEVKLRRLRELAAEVDALFSRRSFPLANLERHHPASGFEILPGLPPYGSLALPFPESGRGLFSEGLVVKFSPLHQEAWIGNFQRGLSGPDMLVEHPDQQHIMVIATGVGYIINPETAELTHQIPTLIKQVISAPDLGAVVLGDDMQFESFRADGRWWHSGPISSVGFRNIIKSGTILTGESFSDLDDLWSPFALDLTSGAFAGGSIPRT